MWVGFGLGDATRNFELEANWSSETSIGAAWKFTVRNYDTVTHPFTYYLECLTHMGVSASYPRADGNPAYASEISSAGALCPSGAAVAGGGFEYTRESPGNQYLGNLSEQAATAVTNVWQSAVYIMSGYGLTTATSTAAAVCLSFP